MERVVYQQMAELDDGTGGTGLAARFSPN